MGDAIDENVEKHGVNPETGFIFQTLACAATLYGNDEITDTKLMNLASTMSEGVDFDDIE